MHSVSAYLRWFCLFCLSRFMDPHVKVKVNTPCCRGLTGILSLPAVVLVKVVQLIVQEDRCSHAARRCERDVAERPIPIQLHSTGRDSRWNVI